MDGHAVNPEKSVMCVSSLAFSPFPLALLKHVSLQALMCPQNVEHHLIKAIEALGGRKVSVTFP